jgi:hypothetical protein
MAIFIGLNCFIYHYNLIKSDEKDSHGLWKIDQRRGVAKSDISQQIYTLIQIIAINQAIDRFEVSGFTPYHIVKLV